VAKSWIVTQSGSNQLHGALFEYCGTTRWMRRTFSIGAMHRRSKGISLELRSGAASKRQDVCIRKLRRFRQHLHQTSAPLCLTSRPCRRRPSVQLCSTSGRRRRPRPRFPRGLHAANDAASMPAESQSVQQPAADDSRRFGTARVDHIFSQKAHSARFYTVDDGNDFTATPLNPFSGN